MVETAEGWGIIQKAVCWYLVVFGETPGQERLSCDVFVAVPKYLAQPRCALRADGKHQIEGSCRRSGFFCVCALGDGREAFHGMVEVCEGAPVWYGTYGRGLDL